MKETKKFRVRRWLAGLVTFMMLLNSLPTTILAEGVADLSEAIVEAEPTAVPTAEHTAVPTAEPTAVPTVEPTAVPTTEPTTEPTTVPTTEPTAEPIAVPTEAPTAEPTSEPTAVPADPTEAPVNEPVVLVTPVPVNGTIEKDGSFSGEISENQKTLLVRLNLNQDRKMCFTASGLSLSVNLLSEESGAEKHLKLKDVKTAAEGEDFAEIVKLFKGSWLLTVEALEKGTKGKFLLDARIYMEETASTPVPELTNDLSMLYPEGNHMAEYMQEEGMFVDNLAKAGIKMTLVPASMQDLLSAYYRESERTTDMIYLATNFHVIVDPSITYSADKTANHLIWNNTYSDDEDLWNRAVAMRETEPGDFYGYMVKWLSFQQRYNEVLPTIPVYSNIYYDFYTSRLQNYDPTAHVTWTQAILLSYLGAAAK